ALLEIDVTASEDADPEAIEAALVAELDRLAAEPPTREELARICLRRETDLAVTMQESGERAERIGMYAVLLDEPERFGRGAARERELQAGDISGVAGGI